MWARSLKLCQHLTSLFIYIFAESYEVLLLTVSCCVFYIILTYFFLLFRLNYAAFITFGICLLSS